MIAAPGWTTTGTFTVVDYVLGETRWGAGEILGPSSPGPSDRGANFFSGGPNSATSTASQTISLASYSKMTREGATFRLTGWLGGYDGQDDNAVLSVTFKDAHHATIGTTTTIGPVLAADRSSTNSLIYRDATAAVPTGAQSVVVTLTMTRGLDVGNVYNDGYADSLALVLIAGS